jgi:hypothetical protein
VEERVGVPLLVGTGLQSEGRLCMRPETSILPLTPLWHGDINRRNSHGRTCATQVQKQLRAAKEVRMVRISMLKWAAWKDDLPRCSLALPWAGLGPAASEEPFALRAD